VQPAWSAEDLPAGRTQLLNVCGIWRIDHHPAERDEESSPETIADTENLINWNGELNYPNDSEDDWEADNQSDMELQNGSEDSEILEQQNVSVTANVLGWIRHIWL
jgi:hypothetical protein